MVTFGFEYNPYGEDQQDRDFVTRSGCQIQELRAVLLLERLHLAKLLLPLSTYLEALLQVELGYGFPSVHRQSLTVKLQLHARKERWESFTGRRRRAVEVPVFAPGVASASKELEKDGLKVDTRSENCACTQDNQLSYRETKMCASYELSVKGTTQDPQ
ncbi:hypothetical protein BDZ89DRAFT_1114056 [Hymenopellis radicata]|nr:hypothetical protein BDZ89DRAFT_1114056 [Hymenopellis radicata]